MVSLKMGIALIQIMRHWPININFCLKGTYEIVEIRSVVSEEKFLENVDRRMTNGIWPGTLNDRGRRSNRSSYHRITTATYLLSRK